MKPMFGLNLTDNEENEQLDGREFLFKEIPEDRQRHYDQMLESALEAINESELPIWMQAVKSISGFIGAVCILSYIRVVVDMGLAKAISNAPFVAILALVSITAWGVLTYMAKKRERCVSEAQDIEGQNDKLEAEQRELFSMLGVPTDANRFDAIVFSYKISDGEIKPHSFSKLLPPFVLAEFRAYTGEDGFFLADISSVYRLDKSELKYIETVNKRTAVHGWNKEESPTKGEFKQYKLAVNGAGWIYMKPYYILHIEKDGEEYGLYFPLYELPLIERLTGLSAE